jgi:hypothetical protein
MSSLCASATTAAAELSFEISPIARARVCGSGDNTRHSNRKLSLLEMCKLTAGPVFK